MATIFKPNNGNSFINQPNTIFKANPTSSNPPQFFQPPSDNDNIPKELKEFSFKNFSPIESPTIPNSALFISSDIMPVVQFNNNNANSTTSTLNVFPNEVKGVLENTKPLSNPSIVKNDLSPIKQFEQEINEEYGLKSIIEP